jgi:manganese efflux pump family protein
VPETDIFSVLLIALALSADCFAVSLSSSLNIKTTSLTPILRMSSAFGLAQALMTGLGWLVGHTIVDLVSAYDHWIAFILLAIIGGRMIWESFRPSDERKIVDASKGFALIGLAVATSIDALAVGLSFAFLHVNILMACLVIGLVAFGVTLGGFFLGKRIQAFLGRYAEVIGGVILIAIGIRVLLSHIFKSQ